MGSKKAAAAPRGISKLITLKNKDTGQLRHFRMRYWSWEGFFSVIGLSQFLMGDYVRGVFHLMLFSGLTVFSLQDAGWAAAVPYGVFVALVMVIQAIGYNRFQMMKLLHNGWVFEKPHAPEVREACKQWKLTA